MSNLKNIRPEVEKYVLENVSEIIGGTAFMSDEDMEHIIDIAVSIVHTRDKKLIGGSFVQAVVADKLEGAVGRADRVCIRAIKLFVLVKNWCYPQY